MSDKNRPSPRPSRPIASKGRQSTKDSPLIPNHVDPNKPQPRGYKQLIKYNEASRLHFKDAINEDAFEPNTSTNYYYQSDIEAILNYLKENSSQ